MAGYSGTPLAMKLGIKAGSTVFAHGAPGSYRASLEPLPESVRFVSGASTTTDVAHVFTTERKELSRLLSSLRARLAPSAALWVSWPKKASRVKCDITEDTVRELALPLGFVDIKVCAVDDVWSALKLVVRKELR